MRARGYALHSVCPQLSFSFSPHPFSVGFLSSEASVYPAPSPARYATDFQPFALLHGTEKVNSRLPYRCMCTALAV